MKIFLSFLQSPKKHPIPAYDFWQYYIKSGIEEAGYEWTEHADVDWAYGLVPKTNAEHNKWKDEAWSKTLKRLKEQPVDLFLSYLYPEQIDTGAIEQIKKLGIPCVNFYCDNVRQFTTAPAAFSVFNLNWVPEFKAVTMYKKAGYACINLPMPMWIPTERRTAAHESNSQITFIGSHDVQRLRFFEEVINKAPALDLHIYGNGWNADNGQPASLTPRPSPAKTILNQFYFLCRQGPMAYTRKMAQRKLATTVSSALATKVNGIINFDTYNKLTAGSMITVGVNRYPSFRFPLDGPDTYSRLRDIEAPMLGACYLTEYTEGIENMYDIDSEIAVYKKTDEFIEQADRLTGDRWLRKTLRSRGQKRALVDHSIPRSLYKIAQQLKVN